MLQASQKAVVQEANIHLIRIRNAEIRYFSNFFLNFATQASVVLGVIIGAISQTPAVDAICGYVWVFFYSVGSAINVGFSVLSLLTAVFTAVYGEGFALRGPLGSMVRTVEGMVYEQEQIVYTFVVNMFIFVVMQEAGMFFLVMDRPNAIFNTIFVYVMLVFSYHHAIRIYNRFYWDKTATAAYDDEDPETLIKEFDPRGSEFYNMQAPSGLTEEQLKKVGGKKVSFLRSVRGKSKKSEISSAEFNTESDGTNLTAASAATSGTISGILSSPFVEISHIDSTGEAVGKSIGGYMALQGKKSFGSETWERKFFVIFKSLIFYYKDKQSFHKDKGFPINRRPIDLEGYCLIAETIEPPYQITIVPLDPDDTRKTWKFRCDTGAEFHKWVEVLSESIQSCNDSRQSELIQLPQEYHSVW